MKGLSIATAALLLLTAAGAAAQGSVGAGTSGSTGGGSPGTGAAMEGGSRLSIPDRLDQPMASVPPARNPVLHDVEPRSALGESRFTNRVDDPPRGDHDNAMPPGGDRPLRIETEHDRTGMRPAQAPGTISGR